MENPAGPKSRGRGRAAKTVEVFGWLVLTEGVVVLFENPQLLPVTSKRELMARFDDWATDRAVTIDKARAFAENTDLIGERFLGRYTLDSTSGTTGKPGIFVLDDRSMAVTNAMLLR